MHRRRFASLLALSSAFALGGAAKVSWRAVAQAPAGRPKRIGIMMAIGANDPEGLGRIDLFRRGLAEAGWVDGRNIVLDIGWYSGNLQLAQELARGHVERATDVVLVNGTPGMDAMRALGAAQPIVFVVVSNPVGAGYVTNLSRPGSNITGFSTFEPEIAGKWLQLLKQVVPGLKNVSMLLDPKFTGFHSLWQAIAEIAPTLGVKPLAAHASSLAEIERAIADVAHQESAGLIIAPSPNNSVNRARIAALTTENRIPTIAPFRFHLREGMLLTYGFNASDQFMRAAAYVSRILSGEKPGDLPVQAPSVFELGINLKTAKAIGVSMPQSLLITADEIIE